MIIITNLTQPSAGAVVALHCDVCRSTVFVVSEYAAKPARGDYWGVEGCADDLRHNLPRLKFEFAEKILPKEY